MVTKRQNSPAIGISWFQVEAVPVDLGMDQFPTCHIRPCWRLIPIHFLRERWPIGISLHIISLQLVGLWELEEQNHTVNRQKHAGNVWKCGNVHINIAASCWLMLTSNGCSPPNCMENIGILSIPNVSEGAKTVGSVLLRWKIRIRFPPVDGWDQGCKWQIRITWITTMSQSKRHISYV